MRLLPKNKRRALFALLALTLALYALRRAVPVRWWADEGRVAAAVLTRAHIQDDAGVLTADERRRFEQFCLQIEDESGTDIRLLLVPAITGESIEDFAVRRARELGLGRSSDRRGLLFVYDVGAQRLRIEVGPKLEGIITDAFTGYLMREHVRHFLRNGTAGLGLRTMLFMVQHRIRDAVLGGEFDPRFADFIADSRRLAEGAGASAAVQTGVAQTGFLNADPRRTSAPTVRQFFAPQPTPDAAYQRYLAWLALGTFQADVPLFTPASQGYLAGLPMTAGYNEYLLSIEYQRPYQIDERGDLALLYFTTDPLLSPHFFRRTPEGWVMDIVAEVRDTRNHAGFWYTWAMVNTGDDFNHAFADRIILIGSILRIRGGDNRILPTRRFPKVQNPAAPAAADTFAALTVGHAADRIGAERAPRTLVVLYSIWSVPDRKAFPRLVEVIRRCRTAGAALQAYSIDNNLGAIEELPSFLAEHDAPFVPVRLYRWQPGQLSAAMARVGISVGRQWRTPLLAVRSADGNVVRQVEGLEGLASGGDATVEACAVAPASIH
jgi:hypothetical protein